MRVLLALLLAILPALTGASTSAPRFAQATETKRVFPNAAHDTLGGDDVECVTNAQHQRIGRRVNGGPWTWLLYAGGLTPVAEYDADFRLRKVFVYGPGHAPDHVITFDAAGLQTARYRLVTDQAGSILGLVDDAGAWVLAYDYTPFGRRTLLSAAPGIDESLTPFGFAAGDPTTGVVRFGARDYDPHTARWMAKDPIDFAGGDTNLYAYVGGDPVDFVDPSGLRQHEPGFHTFGNYGPAPVPAYRDLFMGVLAFVAEEVVMNVVTGGTFTILRGAWKLGTLARKAARARWVRCPAPRAPGSGKLFSGTEKGWASGATPNSKYVQTHPQSGRAIQTTIYDDAGNAVGHVDWKAQHGVGPGHGHGLGKPGDLGSGHGGRGTFHQPGELPPGWGDLPPGIEHIHPMGGN